MRTDAARVYLLTAVTLVPAPFLMPLSRLYPPSPDRMIVWPTVVFASAPLAVLAVLFAVLHELHGLVAPSASRVARIWGAGALLGALPLALWVPGPAGYYFTVGLTSLAQAVAAAALVWLARDVWQRRLRGRWWFIVGLLQVALLVATAALQRARQFWVSGAPSIEEVAESLARFALDCALAAGVLATGIVVAWWLAPRPVTDAS